jgi:hypothetical protein
MHVRTAMAGVDLTVRINRDEITEHSLNTNDKQGYWPADTQEHEDVTGVAKQGHG